MLSVVLAFVAGIVLAVVTPKVFFFFGRQLSDREKAQLFTFSVEGEEPIVRVDLEDQEKKKRLKRMIRHTLVEREKATEALFSRETKDLLLRELYRSGELNLVKSQAVTPEDVRSPWFRTLCMNLFGVRF